MKTIPMSEVIFVVTESLEGGYEAKCISESIFTEGETIDELKDNVKEAVSCHFDEPGNAPKIIRLHFVKDELIAI